MALQLNRFAELAGAVRAGNTDLKAQMRRELEPGLRYIIARALAADAPVSPVHDRIRAATRRLGDVGDASDHQRLVRVLCQRVVSRLAPTATESAPTRYTLAG